MQNRNDQDAQIVRKLIERKVMVHFFSQKRIEDIENEKLIDLVTVSDGDQEQDLIRNHLTDLEIEIENLTLTMRLMT